ncbi:helix-turn-helix domain-containing protein [Tenacibaculum haliotis]|uniref:helix-turn-helix domain-containing protein n=1 Tax=Tenacibaculum haliotis TaxID=1888914 RepID=UPI0021B07D4B|nr:helix-turn-helix transcriptional regulator [Tenacibaculum haliotis]MCT4698545.1 helix-turn-helix domain-containing protein [Tenacibaculum haliotis]
MNKFGDLIRTKREEQEMLLRHLSAQLDMDTAMLSKIERGEKTARKEHIKQLSKIFNLDYNELISLWLADKIHLIIKDEKNGLQALEIVEKEYKKK